MLYSAWATLTGALPDFSLTQVVLVIITVVVVELISRATNKGCES